MVAALVLITILLGFMVPSDTLPGCPWNPFQGTASAENRPPVAFGGNITVEEPGTPVFFSALGSYDPDGEIVLFEWDFTGDGNFTWNSTEHGNTEHVYQEEGVYNATLRVTDNDGATATHSRYVIILRSEDDDSMDYSRIRAILTLVGILEIIAGIAIFAVILYLRRKLYDVL